MTTYTANPQFGGDIAAYIAEQDYTVSPFDPTTAPAATYAAAGTTAALGVYSPMDIINIPDISAEAEMDNVMALGSFTRVQRNVSATKPSLHFTQKLRTSALMQAGVRNGSGQLNYYAMIEGNAGYARQIVGAKCESMDIDIPFESGAVSVALGFQALFAQTLALADVTAAAIPVMTYANLALPVYYGYNAAVTLNGDDYTDFIKRIRIGVRHELERLPTKRKSISIAGTPTIVLVSRHIKEKTQMTSVSLELYQGIPIANVAILCRTNPVIAVNLTDDCHPGRGISISLTDVSFASDKQTEGDVTSLLNFSAEADARTFVIAETLAS
ncbi:MAG: hypothetical protein ACRYFS_03635 [Janthinobacterium lividum]